MSSNGVGNEGSGSRSGREQSFEVDGMGEFTLHCFKDNTEEYSTIFSTKELKKGDDII